MGRLLILPVAESPLPLHKKSRSLPCTERDRPKPAALRHALSALIAQLLIRDGDLVPILAWHRHHLA